MTNKELFILLNKNQQLEIIKTLAAYDEVHVEYYNGNYHITTNYCLRDKYPNDFKVLNTFTNKEFYKEIKCNYHLDWYNFVEEKESKGEKNIKGNWQSEFETLYEPIYQKAYDNYLKVNA